jgi:hypothetical protein
MATVVNARDIALAATSPRTVAVTIPGDIGWTGVLDDDGNKPADNADPTQDTIVTGIAVTGGGITLSSGGAIKGGQTAYATGTGWFLGYSGGAYKFSIGDATHFLRWDGSAFTYSGDISGSGDITSSGTFTWTGGMFVRGTSSSGGLSVSLVVNDGGTVDYGTFSLGKVAGVLGQPTAAGGAGVWGKGSAQVGVKAEASTGHRAQAGALRRWQVDRGSGRLALDGREHSRAHELPRHGHGELASRLRQLWQQVLGPRCAGLKESTWHAQSPSPSSSAARNPLHRGNSARCWRSRRHHRAHRRGRRQRSMDRCVRHANRADRRRELRRARR